MSESALEILKLLDDGTLSQQERADYLEELNDADLAIADGDRKYSDFIAELREAAQQESVSFASRQISPDFHRSILSQVRARLEAQLGPLPEAESDDEEAARRASGAAPIDLIDRDRRSSSAETAAGDRPALDGTEKGGVAEYLAEYRILKPLGQGGMGRVFEAVDTKLQRRVAIKTMLPELSASSEHRDRFLKEAQAIARVEHDNICPIYHVGQHEDVAFIVMPLLSGETLDAAIERRELSRIQAVRIGCEIARGLAAAHAVGLVHRDIKPSNIWLETRPEGDTRVRLLDFGLVKFVARSSDSVVATTQGVQFGTPRYMSPEQARGLAVGPASDLFSLGATLYEMLTHSRPFAGVDTQSVMTSLTVDLPRRPGDPHHLDSDELSSLVMQLLSKSPGDRPESAALVADRLESIYQSELNSGSVLGPNSKSDKRTSKRRIRQAIAAALLVLGLAAVSLTLRTKQGMLYVTYDGNAALRIKEGALQIYGDDDQLKYTLTPSEKSHGLVPGHYRAKVVGADGLKIETEVFEMVSAGEVTLRVTAGPLDDRNTKNKFLERSYFPGELLLFDNFDDAQNCALPLQGTNTIVGGRFILFQPASRLDQVVAQHLGAGVDAGAFVVRCRGINATPIVNFATRKLDEAYAWLTLDTGKGTWQLRLIEYPPMRDRMIASSSRFDPSLLNPAWLEIAVRWSQSSYDVWINERFIYGGTLPDEQLKLGLAHPVQIAANSLAEGGMWLELDYLGLWDQSQLSVREPIPKHLLDNRQAAQH